MTTLGARLIATLGPVRVINLPDRRDRRAEMAGELARIGLDPRAEGVTFFPAIRPADRGEFPTIGTRGCFESHLGVLRQIAAGTAPVGLIVEDDADFTAALGPGLDRAASQPWDMFYGYWTGPEPADEIAPGLIQARPTDDILLCHFLAVRARTAARLIPYLEEIAARPLGDPRGGAMHVDGAYNWFRRAHPDVRVLAVRQAMAVQRPSRTDIHALGLMVGLPLTRPLIALARRIKRRLRG
jgi:hypothetical protein